MKAPTDKQYQKAVRVVGVDFLAGKADEDGVLERTVWLYADDLLADGVTPLADHRVVKITMEVMNRPTAVG